MFRVEKNKYIRNLAISKCVNYNKIEKEYLKSHALQEIQGNVRWFNIHISWVNEKRERVGQEIFEGIWGNFSQTNERKQ